MTPYAPYPLNLVRDWFHRRRWWVRLALALVLVPWFAHFAYTRMTTRPARPFSNWNLDAGLAIPDPGVDRTQEMVAAINALPAEPTLQHPTTAPAGMEWASPEEYETRQRGERYPYKTTPTTGTFTIWMGCALDGGWTPTTRYQLPEIIKYLELPAAQSALEQIVALSDKPSCLTRSAVFGLSGTRALALTLIARARYYMAERHDFDSAVRQLEAVFNLASGVEDDQTLICVMVGGGCRAMALLEIIRWGEEFALTPTQTRRLQDLITSRHRDAGSVITLAVRGERLLNEKWIDEMYTHDSRGNGWLVPTYAQSATATVPSMMLLNLFSPFFVDRRRALEFANSHLDRQTAEVNWYTPPAPAKPHKGHIGCSWNPALPTSIDDADATQSGYRILFTRTEVCSVAAVTALAIAAYNKDHGQYPSDLALLVPDYLPALPKDPFADQPLCYRLDEKEGYRLYSVDANGKDDGGVLRNKQTDEELDFPVEHHRDPARFNEWFLLPIEEPASQESDDQPR